MERFMAAISGYKRFTLLVGTLIAQFGGFVPVKYQPYLATTVAVLAAGTSVVDKLYPAVP